MGARLSEEQIEELSKNIIEMTHHCRGSEVNEVCNAISKGEWVDILGTLRSVRIKISFCETDLNVYEQITHKQNSEKIVELTEWKSVADMISGELSKCIGI